MCFGKVAEHGEQGIALEPPQNNGVMPGFIRIYFVEKHTMDLILQTYVERRKNRLRLGDGLDDV